MTPMTHVWFQPKSLLILLDSPDKFMVSALEVHRNHKARHLEKAT